MFGAQAFAQPPFASSTDASSNTSSVRVIHHGQRSENLVRARYFGRRFVMVVISLGLGWSLI